MSAVPSAEPAEVTMARLDALADQAMSPLCDQCDSQDLEVVAWTSGGIPKAFGFRHEVDCPSQ